MKSLLLLASFATPVAQDPIPRQQFALVSLSLLGDRPVGRLELPFGSSLRLVGEDAEVEEAIALLADVPALPEGVKALEGVAPRRLDAVDILASLHPDAVDSGELRLHAEGSRLWVAGPAGLVTTVRQQAESLQALVARPIHLLVQLYDAPASGPLPPTVMDGPTYTRFFADQTPRWSRRITTQSGVPARAESRQVLRYIHSTESEIAQKAAQIKPRLADCLTGPGVVAMPHALASEDAFAVFVQFQIGKLRGSLGQLQIASKDLAMLDQPVVETTYGCAAAKLQNGGAMAISYRGAAAGGGDALLVLRVQAEPRSLPGGLETGELLAVPVTALTSSVLLQAPRVALLGVGDRPAGKTVKQPVDLVPVGGSSDKGLLAIEELLSLVEAALAGSGEGPWLAGGHLLVRGPAAVRARALAVVRELEQQLLRTAELRHQALLEEGSQFELQLPLLAGRIGVVARLLETTQIADLNVEVAQSARIAHPIGRLLQVGSSVQALVRPCGEQLHLQLVGDSVAGGLPPARLVGSIGLLTLPDLSRVQMWLDQAVSNGVEVEHGDGAALPAGGKQAWTRVSTRLRW